MGTFDAGLRTIGDVDALPATVELSDSRLRIATGDTEIGSWPLSEIRLEEIPTGYRMAAEGEQILIEFDDAGPFAAELERGNKGRTSRTLKRGTASPPNSDQRSAKKPSGPSVVDTFLERAGKRFGSYLPEWFFSRAMLLIGSLALILLLVLPGPGSAFLLITGGLIVLLGAVTFTDTMLASRWLPGRTTPQHVLLTGLTIFLMGVLLGMLAN